MAHTRNPDPVYYHPHELKKLIEEEKAKSTAPVQPQNKPIVSAPTPPVSALNKNGVFKKPLLISKNTTPDIKKLGSPTV